MIPHLLNKPQELARAFCVLLKNCLTDPNVRADGGSRSPLVLRLCMCFLDRAAMLFAVA